MILTAEIANIANCSLSNSARINHVSASFAFTNAVRFFAYCIFYYFYYYFMKFNPQRMQTVS